MGGLVGIHYRAEKTESQPYFELVFWNSRNSEGVLSVGAAFVYLQQAMYQELIMASFCLLLEMSTAHKHYRCGIVGSGMNLVTVLCEQRSLQSYLLLLYIDASINCFYKF